MIRNALVIAAVSLVASAQAQAAAPPAAPAITSGTYRVEPDHTQVFFGVSHLGINNYYGQFSGVSGTLTLDSANPVASSLDVSVPITSVMTSSKILTGELNGPKWLDGAKFPTMTFHATKVTQTGPKSADVTGDLTLHGVTKSVVLQADLSGSGTNPMSRAFTVGFSIHGTIKRSDFGVTAYVPLIGDDVDLMITAAFEKRAG